MNLLIENISGLVQVAEEPPKAIAGSDMQQLKVIENSWILINDGNIEDFGKMETRPSAIAQKIDASGRFVFPSFVDSHTHIVFAESREKEFEMRIRGKGYEEIAAEGGGILNSAAKLQQTSEEDLYQSALKRLHECISLGTGAIEIKSGYGLTTESELKMLRVIKKIKAVSPIPVKATFLGAHAIPMEFREKREEYVRMIMEEMLPVIESEQLADYIDVFCDRGFFTAEETDQILKAGKEAGLKPKIHANELDFTGGIQVGVANNAVSVDHLECTGDDEIEALLNSSTIPCVLPATAFFLNIDYPPARKMIDAGLPVALATDYNPGSCPSGNMSFVLSLACIKLRMLPEEAINAATINAACALEIQNKAGSIQKGAPANLFITKPIPSYTFIPYSFGNTHIETIILNGKIYDTENEQLK
jgi:imidazolonepropionase